MSTPNQLEQLKQFTKVVADTGDFGSMKEYTPQDATTNPSLILKAAGMPANVHLVDKAVKDAGATADAGKVIDQLLVAFGLEILKIVPGRVSTEVDARLSFDRDGSIAKAREIIGLYEKAGIPRERVLIKLASTWEGIKAAELLQKEKINCNMTLLFSFTQAVACADAKVQLISPFVGRILDWYKKDTGRDSYPPAEDPGVQSVTRIYAYYKAHGHKTEIMGASFRNLGEIIELAGCDLLTIAPSLLAELAATDGTLERKLDPAQARPEPAPAPMDEATFRRMHADDRMANDKLDEGVKGFSKALVELENLLLARLDGASTDR